MAKSHVLLASVPKKIVLTARAPRGIMATRFHFAEVRSAEPATATGEESPGPWHVLYTTRNDVFFLSA